MDENPKRMLRSRQVTPLLCHKEPTAKPSAHWKVLAVVFVFAGMVPLARAQSQPQEQPTQPIQPTQQNNQNSQDTRPLPARNAGDINDVPLAGAQNLMFGSGSDRDFLIPALTYYGLVDSNASNVPGTGASLDNLTSINTILGGLDLQRIRSNSRLNVDYLGGGSFSNKSFLDSATHELGASASFSSGRWDGLLANQFTYSSQASFYGGDTPFDVAGLNPIGPISLHTSFLPSQNIFTTFGPRLSDALVAQVDNHITTRTSVTLVGDYQVLHFFDSGLISSSAAGFQAGIDHHLNRRDTIGLAYRFDDLMFRGIGVNVLDSTVELMYQHRVGERFVFQVGAGPDLAIINDSISPIGNQTSWAVDASAQYQIRRTGFHLGYSHSLTGGGGVFLGAKTDLASFSVSRQLSRLWSILGLASFAHNENLVPIFTPNVNAPAGAAFDSAFGSVEVHRQVGRASDLFFGYGFRHQTSNFSICVISANCGSDLLGNQFNFGFTWRPKRIPID